MKLFAGQQRRHRHREWIYGHSRGERRDGMHGDSNMEIYITTCKIDIQWEFAVCLRELNRGSVTTYRDGVGSEVGGGFKREGTCAYL